MSSTVHQRLDAQERSLGSLHRCLRQARHRPHRARVPRCPRLRALTHRVRYPLTPRRYHVRRRAPSSSSPPPPPLTRSSRHRQVHPRDRRGGEVELERLRLRVRRRHGDARYTTPRRSPRFRSLRRLLKDLFTLRSRTQGRRRTTLSRSPSSSSTLECPVVVEVLPHTALPPLAFWVVK